MVRGLFTAHTAMLNEQKKLDVISNNLANAATTAYKTEGVSSEAFSQVLAVKIRDKSVAYTQQNIGTMSLGVKIGEVYTDYKQGGLITTNNTYDMSLEGKGFFMVESVDGKGKEGIYYTRDGSFTLTKEGYLVTKDGEYVLDKSKQRIQLDPQNNTSPEIDSSGRICFDGEMAADLGIVDFEDYNYLEKIGNNLYKAVDGAVETSSDANLHQGFLEASNVNTVNEMIQMITISRAYEANQKMITTIDKSLDSAVNVIGKV